MTHAATFSLSYRDAERARRVASSIRPEVDDIGGDRTRAAVHLDGTELEIAVEADDLVALRAGINTWLSLVGVAERAGGVGPGADATE